MSQKLLLHSYGMRHHFENDPEFDAFRFIEFAKGLGFDGIGLSANGDNFRHFGGTSREHLQNIAAAVRDQDLIFHMDTSGTEPEHMQRMIEVATHVGAERIRTYTRHHESLEEMIRKTIDDLKQVGPMAADAGKTIMVENHEEFCGRELAHVMREVNHEAIRVVYDYGNSMVVLEEPDEALDELLPFIVETHVKDQVIIEDQHSASPEICGTHFGSGNIDIPALTKKCLDAGVQYFNVQSVWSYRTPIEKFHKRDSSKQSLQKNTGTLALVDEEKLSRDAALLEQTAPISNTRELLSREKAAVSAAADYFFPIVRQLSS